MSNPQKIALLTDSCADLDAGLRGDGPIYVVPLQIICEDGEFSDGVDITAADVYARLRRGETPKTSLPAGGAVERALNQIAADGFQRVIAVTLSSGLSGTFNMVRLLADQREDLEVQVFDSMSGSLGLGLTVLRLWEEIQAGTDWHMLVQRRVPHLIANTFPFFSVDTLEYLQRGGRIGKVTAMAGTMLSIKPIISFTRDGQLESVAKVRGRKQVQEKLVEMIAKALPPGRRFALAVANGGAEEEMEQLAARLEERFPQRVSMWRGALDATLSVYIGDGVLGAAVQLLDEG